MTKVLQVKGCDVEIEMSDSTFKPMRKKPTLAIRQGNEIIKVASFNNWDSALLFADTLEKLFNHQSLLTRIQEQNFEKEIRINEREKVLDEVLRKHNNCNTDLCEYVNANISCCECIVRQLKDQRG